MRNSAHAQSQSRVWLFATPWTAAHKTPLSMEFPRQEYWNVLPFPPLGDLPNPGSKPKSPASPVLAGRFFTTAPPGKPNWEQGPFQSINHLIIFKRLNANTVVKKLSVIICIPIIATANIGKVHNLSSPALGTGSPALAQDSGRYHKNNSRSKSGVMHWFQWRRLWGWPAVMILAYDCVMLTWSPTSLSLETTMLALGNHCQLFVPHGGSWLDLPWACNVAGLKTQENQMSLRDLNLKN